MTREDKIKNIIKATEEAIKAEEKEGTMTEEKRVEILENMNKIICMVKADE